MEIPMKLLTFVNQDASPKIAAVHCSPGSVPAIMAWYGAYHAGDRYTVKLDGQKLEKDRNGELAGHIV